MLQWFLLWDDFCLVKGGGGGGRGRLGAAHAILIFISGVINAATITLNITIFKNSKSKVALFRVECQSGIYSCTQHNYRRMSHLSSQDNSNFYEIHFATAI